MIQRVQSLWLLLAAMFAGITFSVPFYTGGLTDATGVAYTEHLNAKFNILLTVLTVLAGATGFASIFLFENRKLQLKVTVLGLVFTLLMLGAYIMQLKKFSTGSFALSCLIHFGMAGLYILAIRGIRSDEKLIKSLDRLR